MRSKPRLRVAAYVPAHLPEMTDLWIESWSQAMPSIDFEGRRGWFVDHIAAMQASGIAIVCGFRETDGALAGFFTLDEKSGLIDQLAVSPSLWGLGFGVALLDEAKKLSSGKLSLEVNQDNPRAVRFYEREGFSRLAAGRNPVSGLATWRYAWDRSGTLKEG